MTDGTTICDSCGQSCAEVVTLYRKGERYDNGFVHGIGPCCIERFERAGFTRLPTVHEGLSDVDLLALMDPRNIRLEAAEGNPIAVRSAGPAFETSWTPDTGHTARHVYEDRVVELEWNDEEGRWKEP